MVIVLCNWVNQKNLAGGLTPPNWQINFFPKFDNTRERERDRESQRQRQRDRENERNGEGDKD